MIDCGQSNGTRCSRITNLDPLLEKYQSEYHYLFCRVLDAAAGNTDACLEGCYVMPNVARRLLEIFLHSDIHISQGNLRNKCKKLIMTKSKKRVF